MGNDKRDKSPRPTPPAVFARGGAWSLDLESGRVRPSEGARQVLGLKRDVQIGELVDRIRIHDEDREHTRAAIQAAIRGVNEIDHYFRFAPGEVRGAARLLGGPVADDDGKTRRLVGVVLDVDNETRLAEHIAERDAHLSSIFETAPDGMVVIDADGVMRFFSRAAERMFGYGEAEAIGRNVTMLMGEPDRSRHHAHMARYLVTGERHIIGVGRIVTGERKDGAQFPLHLSVGEASVEGRPLFTGFMHDLTEERRAQSRTQKLQAELAHISRLSALGEMGSALAHELNQPLAAVGNYITGSRRLLADLSTPGTARIEGALERAAEQVMRAGQIIRRLRDFVSRREAERRVESVAKLVEEASGLGLVGARDRDVTIKYKLDAENDAVFADRVQIGQVLVNLLRNGLDAMEGAARRDLTVSSRAVDKDRIEIAVADTGSGISREALGRLFDPFFTTKATGLGVGLSISRGIVEAHGGEMRAENNETGGATFRFTLPLHKSNGTAHEG